MIMRTTRFRNRASGLGFGDLLGGRRGCQRPRVPLGQPCHLLLHGNLDRRMGNVRVAEARVLGRVRAVLGPSFRWRLRFRREVGKGRGRHLLPVLRGWSDLVGGAAWGRRLAGRGILRGLRRLIIRIRPSTVV